MKKVISLICSMLLCNFGSVMAMPKGDGTDSSDKTKKVIAVNYDESEAASCNTISEDKSSDSFDDFAVVESSNRKKFVLEATQKRISQCRSSDLESCCATFSTLKVVKNSPIIPVASSEIVAARRNSQPIISRSSSDYFQREDLIPQNIERTSNIKDKITSKDVKLIVDCPHVVEKTPGTFSIRICLENQKHIPINNLSLGINFSKDSSLSLIPPIPKTEKLTLQNTECFSFDVNVKRIDNKDKMASLCAYLYSEGERDNEGLPSEKVKYIVSSCMVHIRLNKSLPKKAIIIVPGICGSELFSAEAQVIDGNQYSQGYRIWPPEGAADIVDSSCTCVVCNTLNTDSERLLYDFSLIACKKNGSSKSKLMLSNPILDCRTNKDNRSFGSVNFYKKMVETISRESDLDEYQLIFFSYDWRSSNALTAHALQSLINKEQFSEVVLIAHSMGGLVCSSLVANCEKKEKISKIILLGAPLHGAAKAYAAMENGTFFDGIVGALTGPISKPFVRNLAQKCPSIYEMLPPRQSFTSPNSGYIYEKNGACSLSKKDRYEVDDYEDSVNFIAGRKWATRYTAEFLENAQKFHDTLYDSEENFVLNNKDLNVFNIVAFNSETLAGFYVDGKGKSKCKLDPIKENGDGTVVLRSTTTDFGLQNCSTYFVKDVSHTGLISDDNCLQLIISILRNRPDQFNPRTIQKFKPSDEIEGKDCCIPILSVLKKH